jgi:hypothetical protein
MVDKSPPLSLGCSLLHRLIRKHPSEQRAYIRALTVDPCCPRRSEEGWPDRRQDATYHRSRETVDMERKKVQHRGSRYGFPSYTDGKCSDGTCRLSSTRFLRPHRSVFHLSFSSTSRLCLLVLRSSRLVVIRNIVACPQIIPLLCSWRLIARALLSFLVSSIVRASIPILLGEQSETTMDVQYHEVRAKGTSTYVDFSSLGCELSEACLSFFLYLRWNCRICLSSCILQLLYIPSYSRSITDPDHISFSSIFPRAGVRAEPEGRAALHVRMAAGVRLAQGARLPLPRCVACACAKQRKKKATFIRFHSIIYATALNSYVVALSDSWFLATPDHS